MSFKVKTRQRKDAGKPATKVRNPDLHGFAPDKCETALLIVDVINDLEFPEGRKMLPAAIKMGKRIAALKKRARSHGIPIIYANDNFGRWQSDLKKLVDHCLREDVRGRELAALLKPDDEDYFVLKPKHSAFYSTTLDTLLRYLEVKTLIVTGIAGNNCVLFTANDAYMRDLRLIVPRDCVVSNTPRENRHALDQMRRILKADTRDSTLLRLAVNPRASAGPAAESALRF